MDADDVDGIDVERRMPDREIPESPMAGEQIEEGRVGHALDIFRAGLQAVRADRLLRDAEWMEWAPRPLRDYDRIIVAGMGKASMALAGEVDAQLDALPVSGAVVVPKGYRDTFPADLRRPTRIDVLEGGHPVPDEGSVAAARRMVREARRSDPGDLFLILVSGGGSACCADFAGDISLRDAQETSRLLLESGADIHAVNAVRKRISRVAGGRLAAAAGRADVLALVVSDVVGDDLSVVASGPTVPDSTTDEQAVDVLRRYAISERVPASVRRHLEAANDAASLRLHRGDRVRTRLLGTNGRALEAAVREAERLGYDAEIVSRAVTGEAREVAASMVERAGVEAPGRCLLWGGETTVTVRGDGTGGRNQELALSAALCLDRCPGGPGGKIVLLSGGTDGRDGPTDAAGAWATEATARRARRAGIEPEVFLERNDAYHFWKRAGGLLVTGPTHTNVMDLQVVLVGTPS